VLLKIKMPNGVVLLVRKRSCPCCKRRWKKQEPLAHNDGCALMDPAIRPNLRYWLMER
jgi:hypothetical protein